MAGSQPASWVWTAQTLVYDVRADSSQLAGDPELLGKRLAHGRFFFHAGAVQVQNIDTRYIKNMEGFRGSRNVDDLLR